MQTNDRYYWLPKLVESVYYIFILYYSDAWMYTDAEL